MNIAHAIHPVDTTLTTTPVARLIEADTTTMITTQVALPIEADTVIMGTIVDGTVHLGPHEENTASTTTTYVNTTNMVTIFTIGRTDEIQTVRLAGSGESMKATPTMRRV